MADNNSTVRLADGVEAVIEERGILVDDIAKVIAEAEATSVKLMSNSTGRFLARLRLDKVTVYAEYSVESNGITVYDAYSHIVTLNEDQ